MTSTHPESDLIELSRKLAVVESNASSRNEILIRIEERVTQMQATLSLMQNNYVNKEDFNEFKRSAVLKVEIEFMKKMYYFVASSVIATIIGIVLYASFKH